MNAVTKQEQWVAWLGGSFSDPEKVNERFDWIQMHCHLISPSTICPTLPDGFEVTFNIIRIDAKAETYPVGRGGSDGEDDGGGRRGLGRVALFRLANAAEISWDGERSYRVDDGREPHYCHWHAVGVRRTLSGSWKVFDGDGRMDLREGGAQWLKIMQSIRGTRGYGRNARNLTEEEIAEAGRLQVRDARAKILERAQTGAKLRAIRDTLEIRSYDADELKRPWVVATLIFTGHDADPQIERENKAAVRDRFLAGASALFAENSPRARALPPKPPTAYQLPPVASVGPGDDDPDDLPDDDLPEYATDPIDAEGRVVGCEYCGALDGVEFLATDAGDVPVCSDPDCIDKAHGGVSREANKAAGGPPPPPAGASRPKTGSTPPPPGMSRASDLPPPPRGTRPENQGRRHGNGPQPRSGETIPTRSRFDAGKDIEDASDQTLKFWIDRLARNLTTGQTPAQFRAKDERLLNALRNELASRNAPY